MYICRRVDAARRGAPPRDPARARRGGGARRRRRRAPQGRYSSFVNQVSPSEEIVEKTNADALLINDPPEKILEWVERGGRLIVIGSAMEKFVDKSGYGLVRYDSQESKKAAKELKKKRKKESRLKKYEERSRSRLPDASYGSIIRVDVDNTHPLMFGYKKNYYSLRQGSRMYPYLPNGWNVGTIRIPPIMYLVLWDIE